MSDERRQLIKREEEREQRQADWEAEQRRQEAIEKREGLLFQGVVPHTVDEVIAQVSYGMDRADRIEARRAREGAELRGEHEVRRTVWEMAADQRAAAEKAATTPVSQADLTKLAEKLGGKLTSLSSAVNVLKRRRP